MSHLFSPLTLRGVEIPSRVWMSPMCQYSSPDGRPGRWHLVHLGARAVGGAGLVMVEATAVTSDGRISPFDLGLWSEEQVGAFQVVTEFVREAGAVPAIQLAHAGRKASVAPPWDGGKPLADAEGGWTPVGPTEVPFPGLRTPRALDAEGVAAVVDAFVAAAARAVRAGFEVVEIHAAHGYLLHSFLSPLANQRRDAYGGDLAGRARLLREVVDAVRQSVEVPLFVRVSATDWADERGGLTLADSVQVARWLRDEGVDLVDCSSGGVIPGVAVPVGPGYQVPLAAAIREGAGVPVAAVGMITEADQAESILADGRADAIMVGRALLADPMWPLGAAAELGGEARWPRQYERAASLRAGASRREPQTADSSRHRSRLGALGDGESAEDRWGTSLRAPRSGRVRG